MSPENSPRICRACKADTAEHAAKGCRIEQAVNQLTARSHIIPAAATADIAEQLLDGTPPEQATEITRRRLTDALTDYTARTIEAAEAAAPQVAAQARSQERRP